MTTLAVFTGIFTLFTVIGATSWNYTPTPETKTITPGTTDNLMNNEPLYRDCASSDNKIVIVEGTTHDSTLWVPWGAPKDYREVLICR